MRGINFGCGLAAVVAALAAVASPAQTTPAGPAVSPPPPAGLRLLASAVGSSDLAKSIDFYTNGLGLTVGIRLEFPTATEVVLSFPGGGAGLSLMKPKAGTAPLATRNALNRVVVDVPDLRALETRLRTAGYPLKSPIVEQAQYHILVAHTADPDGNVIELVQRGH